MTSALTPPPPRFTISLTQKKNSFNLNLSLETTPHTYVYIKKVLKKDLIMIFKAGTQTDDICQKLWEAPGASALNFLG